MKCRHILWCGLITLLLSSLAMAAPNHKTTLPQKMSAHGRTMQAAKESTSKIWQSVKDRNTSQQDAAGRRNHSLDQGSDHCPATVITTVPFHDTGTTSGRSNDYSPACLSESGPDVIYQFTPAETASYRISLCGSSFDTGLEVRTAGSCPGETSVACNDNFYDLQSEVTPQLNGGQTYWIIVDGAAGSLGNYELAVSQMVSCPPNGVAEDEPDCMDGYVDEYNGGCNSVPEIFQSLLVGQIICGYSGTFALGDETGRDTDWYEVTLTSDARLTWTAEAEFGLQLDIIQGPCETMVHLANEMWSDSGVTHSVSADVAAGTYWLFVGPARRHGLIPPPCGRAYWAVAQTQPLEQGRCCYGPDPQNPHCTVSTVFGCRDLQGEWTVSLDCSTPCPLRPVNDNCASVTSVSLPAVFNGDNTNSTHDCEFLQDGQGETWHAFDVSECMNVTVSYCGMDPAWSNWSTVLIIGCPCGRAVLGNLRTDQCPDGQATIEFTGLEPGTYYLPVLRSDEFGAVGPYNITVSGTPCPPPPANDLCENAMPVTAPGSYAFDNTWALTDYFPEELWPCDNGYQDLWYCFTAASSCSVAVSTCGNTLMDTKLYVYSGCTCPPNEPALICDDNFCDWQSRVDFVATEGQSYLIRLAGAIPGRENSGSGLLTLATCTPCPAATSLTALLSNDGSHIWLHWNAPSLGIYDIYSTLNKNNDGDPRGGDPDFTLEASVTVDEAGLTSWTDPAPVNLYRNYVVIHRECPPAVHR